MRLIGKMSIGVCLALCACTGCISSQPPICGEWAGACPDDGTTCVLTFREDQSFSLICVEALKDRSLEGCYTASASNIVLQLLDVPPVSMNYSIDGEDLTIALSQIPKMHWDWTSGKPIESYLRTKSASELPASVKQKLLKPGEYKLTIWIDTDNDQAVVRKAFGEKYVSLIGKPIDVGLDPFKLRNFQGKNILEMGPVFAHPEFDGDSFRVSCTITPKVDGDLSGKVVSKVRIKGSFRARSSTLHGTFMVDRVGDLQ
jgi:hypothetical protein